jgi:hypothetical protein
MVTVKQHSGGKAERSSRERSVHRQRRMRPKEQRWRERESAEAPWFRPESVVHYGRRADPTSLEFQSYDNPSQRFGVVERAPLREEH